MTLNTLKELPLVRDLGDGLILRRSTPDDADALAAFNARIHSDAGPDRPDAWIAAWTRDLLGGNHPTFGTHDFTIVEDRRTGRIVSSLNLISQTWTYDGIPFGVGRPELVGTDPEYRNRGLVRAQFEEIHQWSAGRGEMLQAITGIPWYYRQFGYEMAVDLGGGRIGYLPDIPRLKDGEDEPVHLRPATEADLPFFMQLCAESSKRYRLVCLRDEVLWRYELFGRSADNVTRETWRVIETRDGEAIGYLSHPNRLWGTRQTLGLYELKPGVSWAAVTPSVMRYLQTIGEHNARREDKTLESIGFWLGGDHPAYHAAGDLLPRVQHPYAWYLRVPDLPGFIKRIAPSLEKRLAESDFSGHTGDLKIDFYRTGLHLRLERGRLAGVELWKPTPADRGAAAFPDLTFLQLLFGYRTLQELRYAFADCMTDRDEAAALLEAMFPKQDSDVWPVA